MHILRATTVALTVLATVMTTAPAATAAPRPDRAGSDLAAGRTEHDLRAALGPDFAGAWLPGDGGPLIVAVTDPARAALVREHGGQARVVRHSAAALDTAKKALDTGTPPAAVTSWYVDVPTDQVVVRTEPGGAPAAARFVAARLADPSLARVETTGDRATPLAGIRGGDRFDTASAACSVGFSVSPISAPGTPGFVTAGHCGTTGTVTSDPSGSFSASAFPGNDFAWVQATGDWTSQPSVDLYDGGTLAVTGWNEAPIGSAVCASGFTSGWTCGTIQAKNVTVTYAGGQTVTGLTRTTVCRGHGDSGGPFLTGSQAQGTLSGGVVGCTTTGESYYQPLIPTLARYGLRLTTAAGATTPPTILGLNCEVLPLLHFGCDVNAYHPDPQQISWTVNGVAVVDNDTNLTRTCRKNQRMTVKVTVSNSSGSDSASSSVVCGTAD
ncbi:S1 family peptidase [Actinoplanes sp. NPDC051494]|uniref:S1 family peptidase n=1 Tax=Actinoplanes sp. NPDC051494 TaxID=3363907 RepID=UPI003791AF8F